jgi:hypothetical protein
VSSGGISALLESLSKNVAATTTAAVAARKEGNDDNDLKIRK